MASTINDAEPRALRFENSTEMVSARVGIPFKTFIIHRSIAAAISELIEELIPNEQDGGYTLEVKEFSPKAFELFMRYCYCGSMGRTAEHARIAEAYLLGDYLCAPRFMQAMLDTAIRKNMVIELMSYVLEHTSRGESRRNSLLDWFTNEVRDGKYHVTEESDKLKPYMPELYAALLSMSRKRPHLDDTSDDAGRKRNCTCSGSQHEDVGVVGSQTRPVFQVADECRMITPVSPTSGSPNAAGWVSPSVAEVKFQATAFPIENQTAITDTTVACRDPRPYRPSKYKGLLDTSLRHSHMSASSDNISKVESADLLFTSIQPSLHLYDETSANIPDPEKPRRNSNAKCRCCLESFATKQELFTHVARTHPDIPRSTSGKPLWDQADIAEIGRPLLNSSPQLTCRVCGLTFKDFAALRAHITRDKH